MVPGTVYPIPPKFSTKSPLSRLCRSSSQVPASYGGSRGDPAFFPESKQPNQCTYSTRNYGVGTRNY